MTLGIFLSGFPPKNRLIERPLIIFLNFFLPCRGLIKYEMQYIETVYIFL